MTATGVMLAIASGLMIFLGLPVARLRGTSERMRHVLALISAGLLLFLVIEVGHHAIEIVEASVSGDSTPAAVQNGVLFIIGFTGGLIGLAWLEERRPHGYAAQADALSVATMIAAGVGLHNFAVGLAIGQSFAGGAVGLGATFIVGFALHNATEGFGIAAPLVGQGVSWTRLLWLGISAAAPLAIGTALGGLWVNPSIELLCLSVATGSLIYVTRELLRLRFHQLSTVGTMLALTCGFLIGFAAELTVEAVHTPAKTSAAVEVLVRAWRSMHT